MTSVVTLVWSRCVFLDTSCTMAKRLSSSSPFAKAWRQTTSTTADSLTVRLVAGVVEAAGGREP